MATKPSSKRQQVLKHKGVMKLFTLGQTSLIAGALSGKFPKEAQIRLESGDVPHIAEYSLKRVKLKGKDARDCPYYCNDCYCDTICDYCPQHCVCYRN